VVLKLKEKKEKREASLKMTGEGGWSNEGSKGSTAIRNDSFARNCATFFPLDSRLFANDDGRVDSWSIAESTSSWSL
jgi:hypothetical protein